MCKHWENVRMDCKYLDCGCVVSCKQQGGVVIDCNKILGCDYHTWRMQHPDCQNCHKCMWCGTCDCPERFGI